MFIQDKVDGRVMGREHQDTLSSSRKSSTSSHQWNMDRINYFNDQFLQWVNCLHPCNSTTKILPSMNSETQRPMQATIYT